MRSALHRRWLYLATTANHEVPKGNSLGLRKAERRKAIVHLPVATTVIGKPGPL